MEDTEARKVFGPARLLQAGLGIVGVSFIVVGAFPVFIIPDADMEAVVVGIICLVMALALLLMIFFDLRQGGPKIVLTRSGLEYQANFRLKFYRWQGVGVFAFKSQRMRHNVTRYICAYTDINHDALHGGKRKKTAGLYDADIKLVISQLEYGRSDQKAQQLVEEINEWRLKYGAPENNAKHLSKEQVDDLRKKKASQSLWYGVAVITVIAVGLFAQVYFSA